MNVPNELIKEHLRQLPASPGVYIFKNPEGAIIYVGKSNSLENRVKSYFTHPQGQTPKTQRLVEKIADLEYFVTNTEEEALILEYNLIQRHQPYYNVRLKDGKSYPYLKISLNEEWPRVFLTRGLEEDGGRYFGPFSSVRSLRQTIKVLKGIFPLRSCTKTITGKEKRPCLNYHIRQCLAPCVGAISSRDYMEMIKQVILFLEGRQDRIIRNLNVKMEQASDKLDFEKAAMLRDQVQSIKNIVDSQKLSARVRGEQDVIAFVTENDRAYVQVFFIRGSRLIGREGFNLQGVESEEPVSIMTGFIKQYYGSASYVPPLLLLQHQVEDKEVIEEWLKKKRGGAVKIETPSRGSKKKLVDIVAENAVQSLRQIKAKQHVSFTNYEEGMEEIQEALELPKLPQRMECYDISNIQGTNAVGSMVVFREGKPDTSRYRRFRIKTVEGADDYSMLREVLTRRFKRFNETREGDASKWDEVPDLVLIDGGKGQLNAVLPVLEELGAESVPLASIAKEHEEIFRPHKAVPVILPPDSSGLKMLQRLRDEAHRFAITYHKNIRNRQAVKSSLDKVPGIGPAKRRALIREFGSVRGVRLASVEDLATVPGITPKLARQIKDAL